MPDNQRDEQPGERFRPPLTLMYHAVEADTDDPYLVCVSPERFEQQMRWLRRCGLRGVSMRELVAARERGEGNRLVGLTFDDGYRSFLEAAVPVLERYGFTATLFAISSYTGQDNVWDTDGPRRPLLSADELRTLPARGIEVGSHSANHVRMPGLPAAELAAEATASRAALEEILGMPVEGFCYPYGDVDAAAIGAIRDAGYRYACAISPDGLAGRFAWPRRYAGNEDGPLRLLAKGLVHRARAREIEWSA